LAVQQPAGQPAPVTAQADAPVTVTAAVGHLAPTEQAARAVIERVAEGGGEVRLRLDPPELGEILIHVTVDGDHVRVHVQADNPDAARLLRDSTPGLSSLLDDRGLGLVDVFVGHEDPRRGSGQAAGSDAHRDARPEPGRFAGILGIEPAGPTTPYTQLRAVYNPDGAFDFRV
jgi:flagellar hook-length control protein FliK